jgi:malate dehydrogenase (oxaloacetate-decarboxylating)
MPEFAKRSLDIHRKLGGKFEIASKVKLETRDDLSIAYTPGVAAVSEAVKDNPAEARALTMKGSSVAIVSDGSAVLGLGNIGPAGALPVMEGKALLFKEFANIDGIPIVLDTHDHHDIVTVVRAIAPTFGGINLEDISAPLCFEVEDALQDLGIPVFHDDQHGTAIVLLAALINACRVTGRSLDSLRVVINGAGAAGTAIAKLLRCIGHDASVCVPVKDVLVCDSKGIISRARYDGLNHPKRELLGFTNRQDKSGSFKDALVGADVFIGVSVGSILNKEDIQTMAADPIIFAMANPIPEIMPDEAIAGGAAVVGTGRSDLANQVNNVLAFPGIFRGALDAGAERITEHMKISAAFALADCVENPTADHVIPDPLDKSVAPKVAEATARSWCEEMGA